MKKAEFVHMFVEHRRELYDKEVKAGNMRLSEAVMGLGDGPKDAARCWRKWRSVYAGKTIEEAKAFLGWNKKPAS